MGRCETVNEKRKGIWKTVVLAVLFMSAQVLLKEDGKVFAVWWLTILVLGWCSFPLCQYLFSGFRDRGYLVAKIFGIAGAGFLMWLGASTGIVPFTHVGCLVSTGVLAAVCWGVWIALKKQRTKRPGNLQQNGTRQCWMMNWYLSYSFFYGLMWRDFARQRTEQKSSWTMGL